MNTLLFTATQPSETQRDFYSYFRNSTIRLHQRIKLPTRPMLRKVCVSLKDFPSKAEDKSFLLFSRKFYTDLIHSIVPSLSPSFNVFWHQMEELIFQADSSSCSLACSLLSSSVILHHWILKW